MVGTAARWLPERGLAGINLVEVARAVRAPRGSLYHYFPGGRAQLLQVAITLAQQHGQRMIDKAAAAATSPADFVARVFATGPSWVSPQDFSGGCPVAAAVLSAQAESPLVQQALQAAVVGWQQAIAQCFCRLGLPPATAAELAACLLMAFHGAMLLAKGAHQPQAFDVACRMVQAVLPARAG